MINLNKAFSDENDSGTVLLATINKYKFLFMGYASVKSEEYILDKYNIKDIDFLKEGHHGSKTNSDKKFID